MALLNQNELWLSMMSGARGCGTSALPSSSFDYVVATPDSDVYEEELGLLNTDIRALRVRPGPGTVPAGVVAGEIYPLPNWTAKREREKSNWLIS